MRGIVRRPFVGFLCLHDAQGFVSVGENYKSPKLPLWVVGGEGHFTLLWSDTLTPLTPLLMQRARQEFDRLDGTGGGYIFEYQLPALVQALDLGGRVGESLRARLGVPSGDCVVWSQLAPALRALLTHPSSGGSSGGGSSSCVAPTSATVLAYKGRLEAAFKASGDIVMGDVLASTFRTKAPPKPRLTPFSTKVEDDLATLVTDSGDNALFAIVEAHPLFTTVLEGMAREMGEVGGRAAGEDPVVPCGDSTKYALPSGTLTIRLPDSARGRAPSVSGEMEDNGGAEGRWDGGKYGSNPELSHPSKRACLTSPPSLLPLPSGAAAAATAPSAAASAAAPPPPPTKSVHFSSATATISGEGGGALRSGSSLSSLGRSFSLWHYNGLTNKAGRVPRIVQLSVEQFDDDTFSGLGISSSSSSSSFSSAINNAMGDGGHNARIQNGGLSGEEALKRAMAESMAISGGGGGGGDDAVIVVDGGGGGGGGGGSSGSTAPTAPKDEEEEELNRAIALSMAGESDMVDNDMPALVPCGDYSNTSGAQWLGPSAPPGTERGGSFPLLEKILRSKWPRIDVTVLGSLPPQLE